MLVSPEEASEVVVILGKFNALLLSPGPSPSPCPRSYNHVESKKDFDRGLTLFSPFLHVELEINFPLTWTILESQ